MTADFRTHTYAAARRPERNRPRNGSVSVITVDRAVWEAALRAANGDAGRIQIVSSTEVVVTNGSRA